MSSHNLKKEGSLKNFIKMILLLGFIQFMFNFDFQMDAGFRVETSQSKSEQSGVKNYSIWLNSEGAAKLFLSKDQN